MIRLNKAMAMLGICSRRDADSQIGSGNVIVNGKTIQEVGVKISNGDIISFCGKKYKFQDNLTEKLWLYYKPLGLVTTHNDEKGRKTVFEDLKNKIKERVISVGRLDLNSEGLLLITNSGTFSRYAESPKTGWERHYKVRIFGTIDENIIKQLAKGVTIDGFKYAPLIIKPFEKTASKNLWVDCCLKEGKNREIRKLFNHFEIQVNRLIRYKYGPYELNDMKPGEVIEAKIEILK